jgi:hypothetical protein
MTLSGDDHSCWDVSLADRTRCLVNALAVLVDFKFPITNRPLAAGLGSVLGGSQHLGRPTAVLIPRVREALGDASLLRS